MPWQRCGDEYKCNRTFLLREKGKRIPISRQGQGQESGIGQIGQTGQTQVIRLCNVRNAGHIYFENCGWVKVSFLKCVCMRVCVFTSLIWATGLSDVHSHRPQTSTKSCPLHPANRWAGTKACTGRECVVWMCGGVSMGCTPPRVGAEPNPSGCQCRMCIETLLVSWSAQSNWLLSWGWYPEVRLKFRLTPTSMKLAHK